VTRELACARCGRRFGCGVDDGACWCAAVGLDTAARERLAAAYDDCLCPACLVEAAPEAAGALHLGAEGADAGRQPGV
jgi:hypothetical protein